MAKRRKIYMKDENGKYQEVKPLEEISVEQLKFDFDQTGEILKADPAEFTVELEPEDQRLLFYKLYNPDDIRDTIVDYLDDIHDSYMNAIYHVDHADSAKDILKTDEDLDKEVYEKCQKLAEVLDLYLEACKNEYLMERDPAFKEFTVSGMN